MTLEKAKKGMHNKKQHLQADYYKKLGGISEIIMTLCSMVRTDAKSNCNILRADHLFDTITIETRQADKMSERQQHAFVQEYFYTPMTSAR